MGGVSKVQSGVDNKLAGLEKPIEALAGFPDKLKSLGQTAAADAAAYAAPPAPQAGYAAPNPYFIRRKTYDDYDYANKDTRKDSEHDVDYVDLSQIKEEDLADYYNLPRSFQVAKIETDLQNILKEIEGAISITRN